MKFKYICLITISPLVFVLDQLTKHLIMQRVEFGARIPVVSGFFDIVYFANTGAAFGFLSGASASWRQPFFYAVMAAALVFIAIYIYKLPAAERLVSVALSLIVGGIFGNGLDRVRFSQVTDFLSFHIGDKGVGGFYAEWPAFNVADSAITVAMVLLIISFIKEGRCKKCS